MYKRQASNNLSYAATWALWQFASKNRILQNLQAVFGKQLGTNLLALAIYQLLDGGAMNGYEDWLPDNWLPVSAPLSSQRISELLAVRYDDIEGNTLHVRRQLQYKALYEDGKVSRHEFVFTQPKYNSIRDVPLNETILRELKTHTARHLSLIHIC